MPSGLLLFGNTLLFDVGHPSQSILYPSGVRCTDKPASFGNEMNDRWNGGTASLCPSGCAVRKLRVGVIGNCTTSAMFLCPSGCRCSETGFSVLHTITQQQFLFPSGGRCSEIFGVNV